MFRDMDQALREMGVGDMGIGKRIQKMAATWDAACRVSTYAMACAYIGPTC